MVVAENETSVLASIRAFIAVRITKNVRTMVHVSCVHLRMMTLLDL